MIGSARMARLLALRERVRDAERASEHAQRRALEEASTALDEARRRSRAALDAMGDAVLVPLGALSLLAQARSELIARERAAEVLAREAAAAHETQRIVRYAAERDVKLAELARGRALRLEDVEATRSERRGDDDRAAIVHHRGGKTDEGERRPR